MFQEEARERTAIFFNENGGLSWKTEAKDKRGFKYVNKLHSKSLYWTERMEVDTIVGSNGDRPREGGCNSSPCNFGRSQKMRCTRTVRMCVVGDIGRNMRLYMRSFI